jgi:hypothetical protein
VDASFEDSVEVVGERLARMPPTGGQRQIRRELGWGDRIGLGRPGPLYRLGERHVEILKSQPFDYVHKA